jgi:hypothetical protein
MILKYGAYAHKLAEAAVKISRSSVNSDQGDYLGYKETWVIEGRLRGSTPSDLTTKIQALEAAYAVNGQDLVLYESDGVTPSAHQMVSDDTTVGTQVVTIEYPDGANAQYSTFRDYRITMEGEFVTLGSAGGAGGGYQYSETITYTSTGGPRFVIREQRFGPPIKQFVSEQTPVMAVQSGSTSRSDRYPDPPPPVFPSEEMLEQRRIQYGRAGGKYHCDWTYQFMATRL